jgi:hypothetical protein
MPGLPVLDKTLTNADWQKNKGKIAKIAGSTGVGPALKKVEAAFAKVDFQKFDVKMVCQGKKSRNEAGIEAARKGAAAEFKAKVVPLRSAIDDVRKLAKKTADTWKKQKTIPASSTKHAQLVYTTADRLWIELKSLDNYFEYTAGLLRKEIESNRKAAVKMLQTWIKSIAEGVKKVQANPTVEEYNASLHQKVRGLGTAVSNLQDDPKIAPWNKVWGNAGFASGISNTASEADIKKQVAGITVALKKFVGAIS